MKLNKHLHYFLWVFFWAGIFLGGFEIFRLIRDTDKKDDTVKASNPFERDVAALTEGESGEQKLLQEALANPEAVLTSAPSSSQPQAAPTTTHLPSSISELREAPVSRSSASGLASEEGPAVEGARRMYRSFASLRTPEVADPASPQNQAMVREMTRMAMQQNQRPPQPRNTEPRSN